jgi:hypothetical protein
MSCGHAAQMRGHLAHDLGGCAIIDGLWRRLRIDRDHVLGRGVRVVERARDALE